MSGAGVDEGGKTEGRGGDKGRGERDTEGVRVGKSGHVESAAHIVKDSIKKAKTGVLLPLS